MPKNYHCDIFEGNACRELIKEAYKLDDPGINDYVGILKIQPFIESCLSNTIVDNYFTTTIVYK